MSMSDPETAVVIDRLRRSNRRWKAVALSACSVLVVLVVAVTLSWFDQLAVERDQARQAQQEVQMQRVRTEQALADVQAERGRAEQAMQQAEEARRAEEKARQDAEKARKAAEQARDEARRALYLAHLHLAQQQWEKAK